MIHCKDLSFEELAGREWLVTNGLGGYAASSLCGANTSRYHGLLIAAINPPVDRKMMVSKVEEVLHINGEKYPLSVNQYPDTLYPNGFQYLLRFVREPLPQFFYEVGNLQFSKTLFMQQGSNTTIIEYKNHSTQTVKLWLNPLYSYRDFHKINSENSGQTYTFTQHQTTLTIAAEPGAEPLYFRFTAGTFTESRAWNKQLQYEVDKKRGTEFSEDYYSLGYVEVDLPADSSCFLIFSLDPDCTVINPEELRDAELRRLSELNAAAAGPGFFRDLLRSGDQFLVTRASTKSFSIVAGYHWFSDWGRDTMIALRGLCIAQGKMEAAKSVILTFLTYLKDGLLPNRFPDYEGEETEYNTADASLWLFIALYEYHLKFEDQVFIHSILPGLQEILDQHIAGTRHQIKVQEDGLLHCGHSKIQVTWMDAKLGEEIFTSRHGLAVEINALWYNALCIFEKLNEKCGSRADKKYVDLARRVRKNFQTVFWNDQEYLNDVVLEGRPDQAIRPNQIYALSLPFRLLSLEKEKKVLKCVEKHLLTHYGLRTLAPNDPNFKEKYEGGWYERDAAYHQGTVWPYLLPEFFLAALRIHPTKYSVTKIKSMLLPLEDHFYNHNCVHGISEVFDGSEPEQGKGCVQQAWSVANLILLLDKISSDQG